MPFSRLRLVAHLRVGAEVHPLLAEAGRGAAAGGDQAVDGASGVLEPPSHLERHDGAQAVAEERQRPVGPRAQGGRDPVGEPLGVVDERVGTAVLPARVLHGQHLDAGASARETGKKYDADPPACGKHTRRGAGSGTGWNRRIQVPLSTGVTGMSGRPPFRDEAGAGGVDVSASRQDVDSSFPMT